jgi:8-oxo-dGTP pyrophosphatase MutT (NUDIX family)
MLEIAQIKARLAGHRPLTLENAARRHAAVALLLREHQQQPQVLFIRRAEHDGDPWSGDLAFPGGGVEEQDHDPRAAAEREAFEEIGLQLQPHQYLGQSMDMAGAYLPIRISCFVYLLENSPALKLNYEVVETFWVPLLTLLEPQRNRLADFNYRGATRLHPVIELPEWSDKPLWGITYRLLQGFLALFELEFKHPEAP